MQVDETLIIQCLQELRTNQASKVRLKKYYEGDHDILKNYKMQDSRSNMKLVFNYPKKFVDEEVGYILGKPVNYVSKTGNDEITRLIDLHTNHWDKEHNINLRKQSEIYGEAYELHYINSDGEFSATVLNPLNCYIVEDGTAENNIIFAIHNFKRQFDKKEYLDVYIGNQILHYEINGNTLQLINTDTHIFDSIPIICCSANSERQSGYKDIIPIVDAYNALNSDLVNEIADHRNAYLVIEGADLKTEDAAEMKKKGILVVPQGAKVSWLIKDINDSFVQHENENLEKKMYELMNTVNMNENWSSNTSGVAIRSKLLALENRCALKEAILENVIKKRLKSLFKYIKIKTGKDYDYRDISIKFTRNVPQDLTSLAQVCTQLMPLVSQETLLAQLPFIENPALEVKRFKEGQAQELNPTDVKNQINSIISGTDSGSGQQ